ncbi:LCP family protein [Streptomyces qinglanensis]|uniref:Cell envelope-related function transcriptional attenuator common domain-containing protein n=1 Tax=Streptomyces qinglanensis TaxID=943816 RepID=A0A1H9U632_9ACTN|nr:LCP family protein [Streptomyces qinglanensis]SES04955.1 cell envelope-related function transcriptional attenuator common domain-containing protein [Streptomyces qinglanensis]
MSDRNAGTSPNRDGDRRNRRRRRTAGRARTAGLLTLSLLVLAAAGTGWFLLRLNSNISTFGSDGLSRDRPAAGAGGQNVLVIGSDARTGGNDRLGGGRKDDTGRSDTAFLLHVFRDSAHAVAVSFPRDTLVEIPPCKLPDGSWTAARHNTMFNAAFSVGGSREGNPACTQNTVEKLTGLRVDHTVVVDFQGFSAMTEAVGGVPVCVPKDLYQGDLNPNRGSRGARVFRAGEQTVSGQRALDYVRIRHGIGDGSDIGRIKRQQAFVGSLVKKIKEKGFAPTTLLPLADAATESLTVDEGLGTARKMVDFAMPLKDIDLENTEFVTVPWRYQGNRVAVRHPQAERLWADLRADRPRKRSGAPEASREPGARSPSAPAPRKPVSGTGISVSVRNGTTTRGLAAAASAELRAHHFTVTGVGNAAERDRTTTVLTYGPGARSDAAQLARLFPGARLEAGDLPGLRVTLGADYRPPSSRDTAAPDAGTGRGPAEDTGRSAADDPCTDLSYG